MGSIFFLVVVFCIINGVLDVIIYGKSREAGLEARSPVSQAVYFTPAYAKVHILWPRCCLTPASRLVT